MMRMNALLARIDELRRAQPDGLGDREWFLTGSRILLRRRQDGRDWRSSGLALLFWGCIAAAIVLSDPELVGRMGILGLLGVILICLWLSGFWGLLFHETLFELDWQQQAITKPVIVGVKAAYRGEGMPLQEVKCIVGRPICDDDENPCPLFGVLRNGRSFSLPCLLEGGSPRRNTAAYGFILDKPALYLNDDRHEAQLRRDDGIDLTRLWATAERLSPNACWDDTSEPCERESAP
jgi:hypothetical protein